MCEKKKELGKASCVVILLTSFIWRVSSFYRNHFLLFFLICQNDVLPQGEKYFTGSSYPIKQTTRHDSGVYICTANNGVQPPASEQINLKVNCKLHLLFFPFFFFLTYFYITFVLIFFVFYFQFYASQVSAIFFSGQLLSTSLIQKRDSFYLLCALPFYN